jgi:Family of unknown function (DUF6421)
MSENTVRRAIIGQPEALDGTGSLADLPAWKDLKEAATALAALQHKDGSIPEPAHHAAAAEHVEIIIHGLHVFAELLPHDHDYLTTCAADLRKWVVDGFVVPDFLDSLVLFRPELHRVDGLKHLVVFPMYTQNGSPNRHVEAVLIEVVWPEFVAHLEATEYTNAAFVPIRFIDFTAGYDTNSAVLFPETVAIREIPTFTWGAIFADREAVRFRKVITEAARITKLELPADAQRLLADQKLAQETFVMWDLIHDRTHMRGDLPFDPFMIKQRMPYFLYSLEEMRCDLTAFTEAVKLQRTLSAKPVDELTDVEAKILEHAPLVQYAVLFDRIFRFTLTGSRTRNYDGLGGQLLFAYLHQRHILNWTDVALTVDWERLPDAVVELGDKINHLYWQSIDRPKLVHWLAAYDLVSETLPAHPASRWADRASLPLAGTMKDLTDLVLDDEFPLSMFYEALSKKMGDTIESTRGMTGNSVL